MRCKVAFFEARFCQQAAQDRLNLEAKAGHQFVVFTQELQETEQIYGPTTVRPEAGGFTDATRAEYDEEFQCHMTSDAQNQSLLAVERRHYNEALEQQANRCQTALARGRGPESCCKKKPVNGKKMQRRDIELRAALTQNRRLQEGQVAGAAACSSLHDTLPYPSQPTPPPAVNERPVAVRGPWNFTGKDASRPRQGCPESAQTLAIQKNAATVSDLL